MADRDKLIERFERVCGELNIKTAESGIKKCCAKCFYYESFCGVCCNGDSEMRGDFTDSEYCCDKYTNYTKTEVKNDDRRKDRKA